MPEDILAELLRRRSGALAPTQASPALEVVGGTDASEAPSEDSPTRFRMNCVELRPLHGMWSLPTYAQLIDVLFDGGNYTFIALLFLHQLVIIKGCNLKAIVAGLRMRTQWVIEQYDEKKNGPAEKHAEVVLSMEFITDNIPQAVAALRGEKQKAKEDA